MGEVDQEWWPGTELNRRHGDFQSPALADITPYLSISGSIMIMGFSTKLCVQTGVEIKSWHADHCDASPLEHFTGYAVLVAGWRAALEVSATRPDDPGQLQSVGGAIDVEVSDVRPSFRCDDPQALVKHLRARPLQIFPGPRCGHPAQLLRANRRQHIFCLKFLDQTIPLLRSSSMPTTGYSQKASADQDRLLISRSWLFREERQVPLSLLCAH